MTTARASRSEKSMPSDNFPRQTAMKQAPPPELTRCLNKTTMMLLTTYVDQEANLMNMSRTVGNFLVSTMPSFVIYDCRAYKRLATE